MKKFKKYFLYAIIALVLMIISALINLQVSNWNEARKAAHEENSIGFTEPIIYKASIGPKNRILVI